MVRKQKKPKLSKEQIAENKRRRSFQKEIEEIFISSGFESLKVNGKQFQLGGKSNELDHCFLYENIMVICEDTLKSKKRKKRPKKMAFHIIMTTKCKRTKLPKTLKGNNKKDFIEFLKSTFPEFIIYTSNTTRSKYRTMTSNDSLN